MNKLMLLTIPLMLLAACGQTSKAGSSNPPATEKRAFDYRALCTPTNLNPEEFGIKDVDNVDYDWALWGHNLRKTLGKNPTEEMLATVDGKHDSTQLCFSSPALREAVAYWVDDQWGKKGQRFAIMPDDNTIACLCEECVKLGNTPGNATPAVTDMVRELAAKYPDHTFFMAAYHSTKEAPKEKLPDNVGVLLSTMPIPMRYTFGESGGFRNFDATLKAWKEKTPLLYVWEYERNFDDYLTPYPCLLVLQQRLKYYKESGVSGVFVNGSGYDYSTFDDVQSYVLAQLLKNPDADVEKLVRRFYAKYYPQCGGMIGDYYLKLERRLRDTNRVMPYYGTIDETVSAYLDPKEFTDFWISLDKASKSVSGTERQYINRMLTAMAYTRLMLKPADEDERAELILVLKDYESVPHLKNYKETGGSLKDLLKKLDPKENSDEETKTEKEDSKQ